MPQYFFHVHNSIEASDNEGRDFADVDAARQEAVQAARELICEEVRQGRPIILHHHIDVEDADGRNVLTVAFAEAFRIES
jgi:hydroxymethylglutaryl-CoA reductase